MKTLLLLALFGLASALSAADPTAPRLGFAAYSGDPKKPESLDFQINTLDRTRPTHFYKVGETIEGTKWKIESFEHKVDRDAQGREKDISELKLRNLESKQTVVLPFNKIVSLRSGTETQKE
jgi:hypothetical protein